MDNSLVFMIYHPIPTWFLPMDSQIEWNIYIYIYIYVCVCEEHSMIKLLTKMKQDHYEYIIKHQFQKNKNKN